ncbi:hypothetical protein PUN28_018270 [Cardiocondyla obscurior]|uniref:Uncharacterized protein n=1 Tax=Cardiocondyla obscurior TaxID=286306 RepID=A0AAW2EKU2_9HYME
MRRKMYNRARKYTQIFFNHTMKAWKRCNDALLAHNPLISHLARLDISMNIKTRFVIDTQLNRKLMIYLIIKYLLKNFNTRTQAYTCVSVHSYVCARNYAMY